MNTRTAWMCIAVVAALLWNVAAFGQGMYWETTSTGGPMGEKTSVSHVSYMPKMLRAESVTDEKAVILRLDTEMMYSVNIKEKTYQEMSFADMENMMQQVGGKMDEAMKELDEQMAGMTDQQREMFRKMMEHQMPGMKKGSEVTVNATAKTRTISGYPCSEYVVKEDGKTVMTVWTTRDVKGFEGMKKDLAEFSRRMMALNRMVPANVAEAMNGIEGFPIETTTGQSMKEVVTKVERKSVPASAFEVPEGYEKVPMPGMDAEGR